MCQKKFVGKMVPFLRFCLLGIFVLSLSACGFFQGSSVSDNEPTRGKADAVLKTAYSQIGKDYVAGGASPKKGFDCSGFVYWVYRKNGYKMPRVSTEQAKVGTSVARKKARKGDLLIFKVNNSPRGLHAAIYAGKNNFIHSPSKGKKVKVDKMDNVYWKDKLVAVRRVVIR